MKEGKKKMNTLHRSPEEKKRFDGQEMLAQTVSLTSP